MSHSTRSSITLDNHDLMHANALTSPATRATVVEAISPDIEHMPVADDPREWSPLRKNIILFMIASATMIGGLSGSIQNPAVKYMQNDLPATSAEFSRSLSAFTLVQGLVPMLWSAISEVKGRKVVYISALALFMVGSIVVAISKSINLVIGFRCLQAAGSSAVMAIGAATLADLFEPAERGSKMGVYYIALLLGPSLGPILGGGLTTGLGWRSIFWFLSILASLICISFIIFFRDTFRKERSLTYQSVLKKRLEQAESKHDKHDGTTHAADPEKGPTRVEEPIISLRDVNPIKPLFLVVRRLNNFVILSASGLLHAFGLSIAYTTARTLSRYYEHNPLTIGLVLVSFGAGSIIGSVLGGRFSDYELARLKAANENVSYPEMRLKSVIYTASLLPLFVIAFGWISEQHFHVAGICVLLFFCGFFSISTYASALAYIVDANAGRSSTAVAANSVFRGLAAFVAIELAVPLQDNLGDGWTYTLWTGLMFITGLLILLVAYRGEGWRRRAEEREGRHSNTNKK